MSVHQLYWVSMILTLLSCGLHAGGLWLIRRLGQEYATGTQVIEALVGLIVMLLFGGTAIVVKRTLWRTGIIINLLSTHLLLCLLIAVFLFQWLMLVLRV